MNLLPWKRRHTGPDLSAYIDGELDAHSAAELSEYLVFDPRLRAERDCLEQISALADAALAPERLPDTEAFADRVLQAIDHPAPAELPSTSSSRLKPAMLASVGLLVTAGLTFAGLRRRGLV